MDVTKSAFSELNFKRWILYNILTDVIGLNATSGPLGFRVKYPFVTWYNFMTPGTITSPIFPNTRAIRSIWLVMGYIIYLVFIVCALR